MSRNDDEKFKAMEEENAGGVGGNQHPLMNISEFPEEQIMVNKVAQQQ